MGSLLNQLIRHDVDQCAARSGPCAWRGLRVADEVHAAGWGCSPLHPQVPIGSSALHDALAYSAAEAPFSAAVWAPQLHGPRLPLPLPSASANPLKRASAMWQQQLLQQQGDQGQQADQKRDQGAPPISAVDFEGMSFGGAAAWVPTPPPPRQPIACAAGMAGRCTAAVHASQQKLRLRRSG